MRIVVEAKDPFLADYKESLREILKAMKGVGPSGLRMLMVEMIRSRWIRDKRASYPFEVAWVFDRNEDSVTRVLKELEESRDIEKTGLRGGKKDLPKPYRPSSMKKGTKTAGAQSTKRSRR